MKRNVKQDIKNILSFTGELGGNILFMGIGVTVIGALNASKITKALMYIGVTGISITAGKLARIGMEEVVDDTYEFIDNVKDGGNPKIIHV